MIQLPKHIAIIMDGNGRWAKARLLPRTAGHKKGVETTKAIVRHAGEIGLEYLTLYAFSTENWARPDDEIKDLMGMLRQFLKAEAAELLKNDVRLRVIGFRDRLDADIITMIESIEADSKDNQGLNLMIALDYGGRQEILQAVNSIIKNKSQVTEEEFSKHLFTADIPDPDLLIRTSGEQRISNFLLWQCAYSEFVFSDILWPDYTPNDFDKAIAEYHNRDRRYGATQSQKDYA